MTTHRLFILIMMAALTLVGTVAFAAERKADKADKASDRKAELQDRFKQRFRAIAALRNDGKIGETWEGYLEAVKNEKLSGREKELVGDENADRKELYRIIADEEGATIEKVGERNAQRNLRSAKKGHWFKLKSGQWRQKE